MKQLFLFPFGATGPVARVRALLKSGRPHEAAEVARQARGWEYAEAWHAIWRATPSAEVFDLNTMPGEWSAPEGPTGPSPK